MSFPVRRWVTAATVLASLLLLVVAILAIRRGGFRPDAAVPPVIPVAPGPGGVSVLGEAPDWSRLEVFQETILRDEFESLLTGVFAVGPGWRGWIEIDEREARIRSGALAGDGVFRLRFALPGSERLPVRPWRAAADLPPASEGRPLEGVHIAIDPGHIGGDWAKAEARWLKVGEGRPVCEGDMTLWVARLLRPRLEALGARVSLVRDKAEPLTRFKPADLIEEARGQARPGADAAELLRLAGQLCHRTAEIRARANHINRVLQPDLVLCLHFNADPWGDPARPVLVERSHLHLLVNGAYTDEELGFSDQRFSLLQKLLSRTHEVERGLAVAVGDVFAAASGLPAFRYPSGSPNALPIPGEPFVWARNLLANRLYECPVIFLEPYVMNSTQDHPRLEAGDYEGLREIQGVMRPSIFREYAAAVADGLARHYAQERGPRE